MKISKLFHWLYAFLMLLPVFFIGGRCLYVTFNKNAKDSYYGETINDFEVVNPSTLNQDTLYTFDISNHNYNFIQQEFRLFYTPVEVIQANYNINFMETNNVYIRSVSTENSNNVIRYTFYNDSTHVGTYYSNYSSLIIFTLYFETTNIVNNLNTYLSQTEDFSYKVFNKYSYLDNAFIYSVNSINDTPLFSWAKTSFLVEPFTYISGLFGIASTNPINTMLSYWLAISIIWLVFDLIMYVPLLVHRWIDKAKLE